MMEFIEIMRCIAAVSVLNSHYDDVYPVPLDGGGGNLDWQFFSC